MRDYRNQHLGRVLLELRKATYTEETHNLLKASRTRMTESQLQRMPRSSIYPRSDPKYPLFGTLYPLFEGTRRVLASAKKGPRSIFHAQAVAQSGESDSEVL